MANEIKWEPTKEEVKAYEDAVKYQQEQGVEKKWRMPATKEQYDKFIEKYAAPKKEVAKEAAAPEKDNLFNYLSPKQKKLAYDLQKAAKEKGVKNKGKDGKEYALTFNSTSPEKMPMHKEGKNAGKEFTREELATMRLNDFTKKAKEAGLMKEKANENERGK